MMNRTSVVALLGIVLWVAGAEAQAQPKSSRWGMSCPGTSTGAGIGVGFSSKQTPAPSLAAHCDAQSNCVELYANLNPKTLRGLTTEGKKKPLAKHLSSRETLLLENYHQILAILEANDWCNFAQCERAGRVIAKIYIQETLIFVESDPERGEVIPSITIPLNHPEFSKHLILFIQKCK